MTPVSGSFDPAKSAGRSINRKASLTMRRDGFGMTMW
jgi:hypothetical protein